LLHIPAFMVKQAIRHVFREAGDLTGGYDLYLFRPILKGVNIASQQFILIGGGGLHYFVLLLHCSPHNILDPHLYHITPHKLTSKFAIGVSYLDSGPISILVSRFLSR